MAELNQAPTTDCCPIEAPDASIPGAVEPYSRIERVSLHSKGLSSGHTASARRLRKPVQASDVDGRAGRRRLGLPDRARHYAGLGVGRGVYVGTGLQHRVPDAAMRRTLGIVAMLPAVRYLTLAVA